MEDITEQAVVRTGFIKFMLSLAQRRASPHLQSILQKSRGKWSAVDSIAMFGWSGSAFLGGIMVDHVGFDWCFLITAIAQCSGWAVSSHLWPGSLGSGRKLRPCPLPM